MEDPMRKANRAVVNWSVALGMALAPFGSLAVAQRWTPPRTVDGQPDLEGIWSNASIVPLERPKELEGKQSFTPEEKAAYEAKVFARSSRDKTPAPGAVGTYN